MYDFKKWQELAWAVGVAVAVYVLEVLSDFDLATDWRAWAGALLVGAVRAAAGAALSMMKPKV